MRVVKESPAAAGHGGVGVAFAAIAQRCAANELTSVVAFMGGLLATRNAFALAVFIADIALTCGLAMASPSHALGALTHFPLL